MFPDRVDSEKFVLPILLAYKILDLKKYKKTDQVKISPYNKKTRNDVEILTTKRFQFMCHVQFATLKDIGNL